MQHRGFSHSRRRFLHGAGALGLGLVGSQVPFAARPVFASSAGADAFGPLQPPDANGLMLPPGFSSRIVARADEPPVATSSFHWHRKPDGGAVFPISGGGWIYVSNSEEPDGAGGVGALEFDAAASVVNAYSILAGTSRNCAGGPTPWGTWLSCEEVARGKVFECNPYSPGSAGVVRPALGHFNHEAAAVDPVHRRVYLTEDEEAGLLYRMSPTSYPGLSAGTLEAARILDPLGQGAIAPGQVRPLAWYAVPNPSPTSSQTETRFQVPSATPFAGGEGCWYAAGLIYFSTKGDNRIWALDTYADTIEILYDLTTSSDPELSNVDNLYVSPAGDVYVAEDPGNLEIVALTPGGDVKPILRITGQSETEVTGPSLSPDGQRLYLSSQRAAVASGNHGITYEVTGPFLGALPVPVFPGLWRLTFAAALAGAMALGLRERGRT